MRCPRSACSYRQSCKIYIQYALCIACHAYFNLLPYDVTSNAITTFKLFSISCSVLKAAQYWGEGDSTRAYKCAQSTWIRGENGEGEGGREVGRMPGAAVVAFSLKHWNLLRCANENQRTLQKSFCGRTRHPRVVNSSVRLRFSFCSPFLFFFFLSLLQALSLS